MLIATSVLKFCQGTNFVTPYTTHHTDIWITIPRVGLKALELIYKFYRIKFNINKELNFQFGKLFRKNPSCYSHFKVSSSWQKKRYMQARKFYCPNFKYLTSNQEFSASKWTEWKILDLLCSKSKIWNNHSFFILFILKH